MEFLGQRVGLHHPDFVITVGGKPVTQDCLEWVVSDREEGKSFIEVELDNLDHKYSSIIQMGDKIAIRFGLMGGEMAPKVEMSLLKYEEKCDRGGVTVKLHGLDDTHQLDNQSGRGQQKGKDVKANADNAAKNGNIKIEHNDPNPPTLEDDKDDCGRTPWKSGMSAHDQIRHAKNQVSSGKGKSISGQYDSKVEGAKTGNQSEPNTAQQQTASGIQPGKAGEKDKNRLDNARKRSDSKTITGKIALVGYPMIFAKQSITILNVGPKASGSWYVSEATNRWSRSKGYTTNCSLLKDALGSKPGPGMASQPMMFYANITKPGTAYSGPRKINAPSQVTFIWGDGNYIISFNWQIDLHSNKGQRKESTGKTVNPDKPKSPIEEQKSKGEESTGQTTDSTPAAPTLDGQ